MAKWNCRLCKTEAESCRECEDGSMFEKMTNADIIRNMDDEELAEFLEDFDACDICQRTFIDCYSSTDCEKHRKEIVIEWLKSEAKE